jgi:quercetin dioxygenase-like cupin family protein
MNLKNPHIENKPVQTNVLFSGTEYKVIVLQIASGEYLKKHLSKVPTLLVCVSGNVIYNEDNKTTVELKTSGFVHIEANVQYSIDTITESNFLLIK